MAVQLEKLLHLAARLRKISCSDTDESSCEISTRALEKRFMVFQPWIQKRRLAYAKHKHVISGILRHAQMEAIGHLLNENGEPNIAVIRKLFRKIDLDQNGLLSQKELQAFIIGKSLEETYSDEALDEVVDKVIDDFDSSGDNELNVDEFTGGICKYLGEAKRRVSKSGAYTSKFIHDLFSVTCDILLRGGAMRVRPSRFNFTSSREILLSVFCSSLNRSGN